MNKIKIISGWSGPGGGTVAHINLTNLLNENGYDCTFYGPHDWHLDKCKGDNINNASLNVHDTVISHFIKITTGNIKKHILYCHEKELFPLKEVDVAAYDRIIYVSNSQRDWHDVDWPSTVIPPVVEKVDWVRPGTGCAGVIGSIDRNKQTHKSIEAAVIDNFKKVLLFGDVTDMPYFNEKVSPYINSGQAVLAGHEDSQERMYGQLDVVYHSSMSETYGLVEAECKLSGIPFIGTRNNRPILSKEEILEQWIQVLKS
jgi:hypothetical protein